ncbi:MAG: hypothetical protein HQ568_00575 [Calditrichaeota bacterium]|nr:hypothetical protein [Calditrichota bacterium]
MKWKYTMLIMFGFALMAALFLVNRVVMRKFERSPLGSNKPVVVRTADGYEPSVVVISMDDIDSLYHLSYCGWKGETIKYISPEDAVEKGYKPCPHCFGDE